MSKLFYFIAFVFKCVLSSVLNHDEKIVKLLQDYVKIPTVTHTDLGLAIEFWMKLASEENLTINIYEFVRNYPVIVFKWPGIDQTLPSIMLNSHMDVVPANKEDGWFYPPFSGYIDVYGDMHGRGTQDMKSVTLQHFEALRRIRRRNVLFLRNVYMTIMPDGDQGGAFGMAKFLKSTEFQELNVGVVLSEGWAVNSSNTLAVFAKEKAVWQFQIDCYGINSGSMFLNVNVTAFGKCMRIIKDVFQFRDEQYKMFQETMKDASKFTSINLSMIYGGVSVNSIPNHVKVVFDARLGCHVEEKYFKKKLNEWTSSYKGVVLTMLVNNTQTPRTRTDDDNPYWKALRIGAAKQNMSLHPIVSTHSTDGRYLREKGIPVFGISPIFKSPRLGHNVNEKINIAVFLKGIDIMGSLIQSVASIPEDFDTSHLLMNAC